MVVVLYVKLAFATAVVLAPGWLVARALGVRSVSATLAWALVVVFGALLVTFAVGSTSTLTLVLLAVVALAGLVLRRYRARPRAETVPGRAWAFFWGAIVGLIIWVAAPTVQGDGLFHLARVRKLLELDSLSLERVSEFADGSLHPGYAFPLWHGFVALIAKVAGEDPEQVVVHLPSILAPLAVVVAFEAGWALFRRTWAAGVTAGAQVAMICFAPGMGGAYVFLSLPATSSRQLLVPAALALALETVRSPSLRRSWPRRRPLASCSQSSTRRTRSSSGSRSSGSSPCARCGSGRIVRTGSLALGALVAPAALFMLWLRPIVNDTRSVSPDADELQRAFDQYGSQLVVHSDTSYNLAPEVFTRAGAVAVAALLLIPLAGFAARRRWAAYVVGGSLAVFAVMLVPFLFTELADLVSISQARRAAGFLPFAFAFAGGMGVLASLVGPILLPLMLGAGMFLQIVYPGDFDYVLKNPAPAWIAWFGAIGAAVALVVGFVRRRPPLEKSAALAAAAFLMPVFAGGLLDLRRPDPPAIATLSPGLVSAVRDEVDAGAIVFSDSETSFRLAAFAPVYIAVAPPGHVADTEENRPYERARDARRFLAHGRPVDPARLRRRLRRRRSTPHGPRARVAGRLRGRPVHALPLVRPVGCDLGLPRPPPPGVSIRSRSPGAGRGSRTRGAPRRSGGSGPETVRSRRALREARARDAE